MKIKNKLVSHLLLNGKKETGEINLLKSIKELQKNSNKKSNEIFQLALIYSTPIFKLHKITNKRKKKKKSAKFREIPGFIKNKNIRTSLAIKFILLNTKNKEETLNFSIKFSKEILLNAKNKGSSIKTKNNLQKDVLTKKRYFLYYQWN